MPFMCGGGHQRALAQDEDQPRGRLFSPAGVLAARSEIAGCKRRRNRVAAPRALSGGSGRGRNVVLPSASLGAIIRASQGRLGGRLL